MEKRLDVLGTCLDALSQEVKDDISEMTRIAQGFNDTDTPNFDLDSSFSADMDFEDDWEAIQPALDRAALLRRPSREKKVPGHLRNFSLGVVSTNKKSIIFLKNDKIFQN